jgi:probable HAF family extracellular repeat protein
LHVTPQQAAADTFSKSFLVYHQPNIMPPMSNIRKHPQEGSTHVTKRLFLLTAITFVLCVCANAAEYSIRDLGERMRPTALNDSGEVVGSDTKTATAFLWKDDILTELPGLGGHGSNAYGINNLGQVAGSSYAADGIRYAVVWQNGTVRKLDANAELFAINDTGKSAGSKSSDTPWQSGTATNVGTLGGADVTAKSINQSGIIAGYAETTVGYADAKAGRFFPYKHAFVWQNGTITDLGGLGGDQSFAVCINDFGAIVGSSHKNGENVQALLLKDGKVTFLGTLKGGYSETEGINDTGEIVGWSETAEKTIHSFIWKSGVMYDLNLLIPQGSKWELTKALAINNRGQIVGTGTLDGRSHGFLLTPDTAEAAGSED